MGTYLPGLNFPIYSGWTQYTPVIPKLYWDVYSAEQRTKQLCLNFDKVEHYLDYVAETMNEWNIEFTDEMQKELDEFLALINSGYKEAIDKWFEQDFYREMVNQVFFGLTDDGRFVAYIPESWNDIVFDTGAVYELDTYGRLILRMDVDSPYDNVEQIPEIVRPYSDEELENKVRNIMNTLYSSGD